MGLLAQHGYGKGTKIDKALLDKDLSGIIFGPRGEKPDNIKSYIKKVKTKHPATSFYIDPQLYIMTMNGNVKYSKLMDYPYFEANVDRGTLSNNRFLNKICKDCFEFQEAQGVTGYISPGVVFYSFDDNLSQTTLNLADISKSYFENRVADLYISLCINENAFNNIDLMEEFLNVITMWEVKGFYIIIDRNVMFMRRVDMQANILSKIMYFLYNLSILNDFDLIIGYSDLISIPLAATCNASFGTGWFNNQKVFSLSNFVETTGGRRPRKRYTSSKLFNSPLLIPELTSIQKVGHLKEVLSESPYNKALKNGIDYWTDEVSCLHNWHVLNSMLKEIEDKGDILDRMGYLNELLNKSKDLYTLLRSKDVHLSQASSMHLDVWIQALNAFEKRMEE
ncbi:MAG: hypothetical protein SOV56_04375 [Phascolarctobacterium sp.]|nr:hypothetical protein [Phascolarctobacterium sp.]